MRPSIIVLLLIIACHGAWGADAAPPAAWPHWPVYRKTPLTEIRPQEWSRKDQVIEGWDWSLPPGIKPAPNGLLAANRIFGLERPIGKNVTRLDLPINQTVELWINWRDLEPVEGQWRFDVLKTRIEEAKALGCYVVLRIHSSATTFAPQWISRCNIPIREEQGKKTSKMTNYDIAHPEFHKRYLRLVEKLGESGIPRSEIVKGAYVGYASPSMGDEGIGPHGVDPDTVPHVIGRLDAWARAFKGVEHKVYMGGHSQHGLKLGFGIRRGFVEMFLYHIPDAAIGQTVDRNGYLVVDESVDILKRRVFHGEENEEYEEKWATAANDFRFGENTDSFVYRYFTANLRLLQMQCNHVLMNSFSIFPEQMVWVGQSLGRTVEDAPDIWCALRESQVKSVGTVKNFERWLYQRDTAGCETVPAVKIDHPITMWMVPQNQNFDHIARKGKCFGFAVDDRWCGGGPVDVAVKVTYVDQGRGTVEVNAQTSGGKVSRQIRLTDSGKLKTATFIINQAIFPAKQSDHDVTITASGSEAVLSFVRIIRL